MAEVTTEYLVLLGIDGSDHSVYAFEWYMHNFHKPGYKILLVHVPEISTSMSLNSQAKLQEHMRHCDAKIASMEAKYMDKMKGRGIEGEFLRINNEKPGPAIVECALEKEATYVVIGTRGQSKVRRTIMGSVSDYIVQHCHVPVLLFRHKSGWGKMFRGSEKRDRREVDKQGKSHQNLI
uniref:UspA domain-containing protein n=1 Tax=Arion vulgaris TaxID=1028688 RepID=A0A0B7A3R2_9EUPU